MDKLWQKNYDLDERIIRFTIGRDIDLDLELAPYDIAGSLAHIQMLQEVGLLEVEDFRRSQSQLVELFYLAQQGELVIEDGVEDIHSQVELLLTRKLGDAGKKIHAGRSRNDQVLLDLRLYFRERLAHIIEQTSELSRSLLRLSDRHAEQLMPGYTHMQVAMVSSFGLWFGAWAECLVDDIQLLGSTYELVDQNPLGSAAGYGSSFPLDRERTTQLLGFSRLAYNVVYAQLGRGKTELQVAFGLAALANTLGRMAMDLCHYSGQNFGFFRLPDELTTGSSIMPHKKNPDVFELIRGRCQLLQQLPAQVAQVVGGLPSGYHRDFQLIKEITFPALDQVDDLLAILLFALPRTEVIEQQLPNDERYRYLYSVEAVNELVLSGMPFRDAYQQVGQDIESGRFQPPAQLNHTHLGSMGNLANEQISQKLDKVLADIDLDTARRALAELVRKQAGA